MTSGPFLIGVALGAVGAWFFARRSSASSAGVGGPRPQGRNGGYRGIRGGH